MGDVFDAVTPNRVYPDKLLPSTYEMNLADVPSIRIDKVEPEYMTSVE